MANPVTANPVTIFGGNMKFFAGSFLFAGLTQEGPYTIFIDLYAPPYFAKF
jgi:hypothetical protein